MKKSEFHKLNEAMSIEKFAKYDILHKKECLPTDVEGLDEGEKVLLWDEGKNYPPTKIGEHFYMNMSFCVCHISIMKDDNIIADKIIGYT